MTLSEIDDQLPNGFHDAEVGEFAWNFLSDTAFFDVSFWIGDEINVNKRRRGRVELQQIRFISIEPPDPRQSDPKPYHPSRGSLQIDGLLTDETNCRNFVQHKTELSPETEIFSFYVSNWNSFIHIAAADAKLIWAEE